MKKNLATILRERTETIEFRAIRKGLMTAAQNGKNEFRKLIIQPKTIIMLENNGIEVKKVNEHGYETFLLSWPACENV